MAWTLAACLALTGLTLYLKMQPCCTPPSPSARQPLIGWILDNGGTVWHPTILLVTAATSALPQAFRHACCGAQAGVAIQAVSAGGLMGTVASQDFKRGDVIMSVPETLATALLSTEYTAAVSRHVVMVRMASCRAVGARQPVCMPQQEQAFALMALRHRHPDWWAFMRPHWDSLPAQGTVLREQSFPDELLALLQDESLVGVPPHRRHWGCLQPWAESRDLHAGNVVRPR